MQKRTKYTSEFRSEAVKLALSSELSSAMISKELGINKNTLYNGSVIKVAYNKKIIYHKSMQ